MVDELLGLLSSDGLDYTLTLRALARFRTDTSLDNTSLRDMFINRERFDRWAQRYRTLLVRVNSDDMQRRHELEQCNPKYILRNYLAQQAIDKARNDRDYSEIERLLRCLRNPFAEQPEFDGYACEPPDWARSIAVSCSS